MSKCQTLRVLVNARLTAAAEEIFALFERTIAEFEEELRRSKEENQRKQERLDSVLNPRVELLRADLRTTESPGPGVDQDLDQGLDLEIPKTPWIKEELEEQCIKQEEDQLSESTPESSSVCVKREESSLLQQTERANPQGEDVPPETEGESSDTDNDEDWGAPFSCSGAQTETAPDVRHNYQVQNGGDERNNRKDMSGTAKGADRRKHQCSFCKKGFGTKHQLTIHTRVHTGERPFGCTVCGKRFVVSSKLTLHMRTHTGERPFSCLICEKTFNQKAHLDAHTRIHTGDRPFSCSLCGKTFTQNSHLKGHMITHRKKALTDEQINWTPELIDATFGHLYNQV